MTDEPDLSRLARTIGEPTRMRMLTLLMQGRALTAKELAYGAGVEPATATAHLRRLEADGLIGATAQGRHKYFRLGSPEVGRAIESLMVVAVPEAASSARRRPSGPICDARFCYDHLAGQLGTRLMAALVGRGLLRGEGRSMAVTAAGEAWLEAFGIDLAALRRGRRQFAYACLDWSERQDHLAGALGAAIAQRMLDLGWISRARGSRVVSVSAQGYAALKRELGVAIDVAPAGAPHVPA